MRQNGDGAFFSQNVNNQKNEQKTKIKKSKKQERKKKDEIRIR